MAEGFASCVFVVDEGRILAVLRSDNHQYGLPGGKREPGETDEEAAIRETREETGIEVSGLTEIYRRTEEERIIICYYAENFSGDLIESDEGIPCWVPFSTFFNNNAFLEYNAHAYVEWVDMMALRQVNGEIPS
jgi:8-oxo-dGTP pyrophosphatase MutT (NUDIX family)